MSSSEYHAIIVDKSLKNPKIIQGFNVVGQKAAGTWQLYKISVQESDLEKVIKQIQDNMAEGTWYLHFYNKDGSKLIIVFKDKIFRTDNNSENWSEAIKYGKSLDIPKEQLDFVPNAFADEEY